MDSIKCSECCETVGAIYSTNLGVLCSYCCSAIDATVEDVIIESTLQEAAYA